MGDGVLPGDALTQHASVAHELAHAIDRQRAGEAPLAAEQRDEAALLEGAVGDDHLVVGAQRARRLDLEVELVGPDEGTGAKAGAPSPSSNRAATASACSTAFVQCSSRIDSP